MIQDNELLPLKRLGESLAKKVSYDTLRGWALNGRKRRGDGERFRLEVVSIGGIDHASHAMVRGFLAKIANKTVEATILGGSLDGSPVVIHNYEDRDYSHLDLAVLVKDQKPVLDSSEGERYRLQSIRSDGGGTSNFMVERSLDYQAFLRRVLNRQQ